MKSIGKIHSFESFGTVDGPGIRFIIFLKGCLLQCKYCHNRDTWSLEGAKLYTVEEVMSELRKYKNFMDSSGGGITVSGGEPFLQHEFLKELFMKCKQEGIHTAVDTSGFVELDKARSVLEYTDLVLLDLKHIDNKKHLSLTGVDNDKIKLFASYLSDIKKPVWIRYVLVPGYTDEEEDLLEAHKYLSEFKNIEKIEVLPYHSMGKEKWEQLGCEYPLEGVQAPTNAEIERATAILNLGSK